VERALACEDNIERRGPTAYIRLPHCNGLPPLYYPNPCDRYERQRLDLMFFSIISRTPRRVVDGRRRRLCSNASGGKIVSYEFFRRLGLEILRKALQLWCAASFFQLAFYKPRVLPSFLKSISYMFLAICDYDFPAARIRSMGPGCEASPRWASPSRKSKRPIEIFKTNVVSRPPIGNNSLRALLRSSARRRFKAAKRPGKSSQMPRLPAALR
jgi:hypothetical protein